MPRAISGIRSSRWRPHAGIGYVQAKAQPFQDVDLASIRASAEAAVAAGIAHIVYVSVAHPAPMMHAYTAVREQGEALARDAGIPATILRPW